MITGCYRRISSRARSIFNVFSCYSSKNIGKPIQGYWLSRSGFYRNNSKLRFPQPILGNGWFQSSIHHFLDRGGEVKRFYSVDRRKQVSHFIKKKRLITRMALVVVSGVVVSIYSWFLINVNDDCSETVPYTKRRRVVICDWDTEKEVGEVEFERKKASFGDKLLPPNHSESIRVQQIGENIIEALYRGLKTEKVWSTCSSSDDEILDDQSKSKRWYHDLESLKWEFIVVDDPRLYAFCYAVGKIVIFRGFLKYLTSDAEIATIIGHEVAHVVARHAIEIDSKILLGLILPPFFFFLLLPDHGFHIMETLFTRLLPFGRRLEAEADYIGMILMASASYDPRLASKVRDKLGEIRPKMIAWESYTSTHPSYEKRAQLLSQAKVVKEAMCLYREEQFRRAILFSGKI